MERFDYLYSEIAQILNDLISKVEKDKGVVAPFERFKTSVDWRLDRGAEKYNQMIQFFKNQGYTFDENIPTIGGGDDWEQSLVGYYLFRYVVPSVINSDVESWYDLNTGLIKTDKQIPEGEQINDFK